MQAAEPADEILRVSPMILSSSKMEDLSVEVCGENGAYYKAFITDIHDEEVSVAFENDWQPERKFPFRRVRLPPTPKEGDKNEIVEGQEVEVYSRANEQEACGWWPALVKMTNGESYVVDYLERETTYFEVFPGERLRPINTNPPLTKNTFHKFELQVPEYLRKYLKGESTHEEFKKAIAAVVCKFNPEKNCLIIFFSSQARSEVVNKRATLLSDMHFRNGVLLLEAARQLESTRSTVGSGYLKESSVRDDLMGLAIGAHGANIQNARDLEGITGIDLDETTCSFYSCVPGETSISNVLFDDEDPHFNDQLIRLREDNEKLRTLLEENEIRLIEFKRVNISLNERIMELNEELMREKYGACNTRLGAPSPTGEQAAKRRINTPRKNTPGKNTPRKYTPRKKPVDIDKIIVALDKGYKRYWVKRATPGHNVSDVHYRVPPSYEERLLSIPDVISHLEESPDKEFKKDLTEENFNFSKQKFTTDHENEFEVQASLRSKKEW